MRRNALPVLALLLGSTASAQITFQGLGFLEPNSPYDTRYSKAFAISADGTTIVGNARTAYPFPLHNVAFRWTAESGMHAIIGTEHGILDDTRAARATTADGLLVVGGTGTDSYGPFWRWSVATGFELVPAGVKRPAATGVSSDGSAVVGYGFENEGWTGWLHISGARVKFGHQSHCLAISADGSTVAGWVEFTSGPLVVPHQAFVSNPSVYFRMLGDLPGGDFRSEALALSADGSVVVGWGTSAAGVEAFRWTDGDAFITSLGDLPGGAVHSRALATNADGSIVIGRATTVQGAEAFLWETENGMRSLAGILADVGALPPGWRLLEATGISDDGARVVGWGLNPAGQTEAWLATLHYGCLADLDGDGVTDQSDLGVMLATYGLCPDQPGYVPAANLSTANPCIDQSDLAVLLEHFGCGL